MLSQGYVFSNFELIVSLNEFFMTMTLNHVQHLSCIQSPHFLYVKCLTCFHEFRAAAIAPAAVVPQHLRFPKPF